MNPADFSGTTMRFCAKVIDNYWMDHHEMCLFGIHVPQRMDCSNFSDPLKVPCGVLDL